MADQSEPIYELGSEDGLAEARRRIAEAAKNETDTLDLGGLGLVDLTPLLDDLPRLPSVCTLYLGPAESVRQKPSFDRTEADKKRYNAVETLPAALFDEFPRLQRLDLDSNQLAALPESVGQMAGLQALWLNNNRLAALPESIGRMAGLRRLDLNNNQLAALPESIGRLTALRWLSLDSNQLTALPESIGQLTELRHLSLNNNQLTVLPDAIGQLTALQELRLTNNQLATLPDAIGELATLQWLYLDNNQLTALPDALGQLMMLQRLSVSNNELALLPDAIGQLATLQRLSLANNELAVLSHSIGRLTALQRLSLANNQLAALPSALGQLTALQELYLNGNRLLALPDVIGQLTALRKLWLNSNRLSELPETIGQLTELRELSLHNNLLVTLPEAIGRLTALQTLRLHKNQLAALPVAIGQLTALQELWLNSNQLASLPNAFGQMTALRELRLQRNRLVVLPDAIGQMTALRELRLQMNRLTSLPDAVGQLTALQELYLSSNQLDDLPEGIGRLAELRQLSLANNPLPPELESAYRDGTDAVRRYLRAQAADRVLLYEAKLVLVGEGEVGKSCLLGALRGDPWREDRPTTHGIEILPLDLALQDGFTEMRLNGWDFGGQPVYRPTHQIFFTAPAVYLVVWKPREGPQQGLVLEWIRLIKHRAPAAKILVVATHGGPNARQPDIDRQAVWDVAGRDTVLDFFHVDSKPDGETGEGAGIAELKTAIARAAVALPEMGRSVPRAWPDIRRTVRNLDAPYLPLDRMVEICGEAGLDPVQAGDFIRVSHRLGQLIHYEHDPALRHIVVLRPDWLATAISYVLDDELTRDNHGLVSLDRLGELWHAPARAHRYPADLHAVFLRLMERFDLCYRIAKRGDATAGNGVLIAQLVPDVRPDPLSAWAEAPDAGDGEQTQICRIVETGSERPASAEGLFFLLIVRLHKYSLGRENFADSVHWKRGLVVQDEYGARSLLRHVGDDIYITVRSPYPERFLSALTYDVQWLVADFWRGLRCDVMVPCLNETPCAGLFDVSKLIENKRRRRSEQPCPVCNEWQDIERLLRNAPAAAPDPLAELLAGQDVILQQLDQIRRQAAADRTATMGRFDNLDATNQALVEKVEAAYTDLIRTVLDDGRDGPRLFSLHPVHPGFFDRPTWVSQKFQLTLWCEHARLPLPALNGEDDRRGVYELTLPRDWLVKAAPVLKAVSATLSLALPVAASATKLLMDESAYKAIEGQLDLGQKSAEALLQGGARTGPWMSRDDDLELEPGGAARAEGAELRLLQSWLKEQDPGFGGLVRVQNKQKDFLWVHPQFEDQY